MTRVLVVEDEPALRQALAINLRARRYDVPLAASGAAALTEAARNPPDVVVLDLGLPDMDGTDVIRGLRGWTQAPIIVLSARSAEADKVDALDAGADDYVTKPFGMEELLARLRAALRRSAPSEAAPTVRTDHFTVDLAAKQASTADRTGPPHADRVAPARGARPPRRQARLPAPAAAARSGVPAYDTRDELPARLHGAAAAQAGARPGPSAPPADRARHGLPVRPGRVPRDTV